MRKLLAILGALVLATAPVVLTAQATYPILLGEPNPAYVAADDTSVALLVKHVGTSASGTVQVSSGDLLFKTGVESSEAATADITGCGATPGTLDVDTTCTTLGVLVDRINVSTSWRAVIIDGVRADSVSGAKLLTLAATAATAETGLVINWDTSVAFHETRCLNCPRVIRPYLSSSTRASPELVPNPFAGLRTILFYFDATSTYASGTSAGQFISVMPNNNRLGGTESNSGGSVSGAKVVYSLPGGASTVNKVIFNQGYGIRSEKDSKTLVRISNSAAASAVVVNAYAVTYPYASVER